MNKVPGELFIGDVTIETGGTDASPKGDHYTIIKGKEFSSRPTAFSFWYNMLRLIQIRGKYMLHYTMKIEI